MNQKMEVIHLQRIVHNYKNINPNSDYDSTLYFLGLMVVRHVFGDEWASKYIKYDETVSRKLDKDGRRFFRTEYEGKQENLRHSERVLRLAELIFNLQAIGGIEERITDIKNGNIESIFAELEFAGHFYRRKIPFVFIPRSGVKGKDYDFQILENGNSSICCEVKCKLEENDLTKNTIINSLQYARKQLPADMPGIIGIKIPENWLIDPVITEVFNSSFMEFFRNSTRVIALIVRWEEVVLAPDKGGAVVYKFFLHRNENSTHKSDYCVDILNKLSGGTYENWIRFRNLIK